MTPNIAVVHIDCPRWRSPCMWLPFCLLWVPLLLLAPLVLPMLMIVCLATGIRFRRTLSVFWDVLCALPGTHVRVTTHDMRVMVRIL